MSVTAAKPILKRPASSAYGLMSLDDVTDQVSHVPYRWLYYGQSGVGKTSAGAEWQSPIFLFSPGEDGLLALVAQGLVRPTKYFPKVCETANDAELAVGELLVKDHGHKTLVVDNVGGIANLFLEKVAQEKFSGDQVKFDAYGAGLRACLPEWRRFLNKLQRLRDAKKMDVVLLAHSRVKKFKNPEGVDYGRYYPDLPDGLDEATVTWADAVLFAQFETTVSEKGKASGGTSRVLQCQRDAAWEAKNRMALPETIYCNKGPSDTYRQIQAALSKRPATVGAGSSSDDASGK